MPKTSNGDFNQKEYNAKWRAENMMRVSATYKISQAEVIRNAMQDAIDQAKKMKVDQKLTGT